jgi:Reverse transcriptase (RNA-dependent DNA polymerase)
MRWLKHKHIDGKLLKFVVEFLQNRSFRTMVGDQESEETVIGNGVPQGAVLSVTLFLIAISNICPIKSTNYKMIGYADDWYIYTSQKQIHEAERILQQVLDQIDRWTQKTGFNISREQTKSIIFTKSRPRNGRPDLGVKLRGESIEEETTLKILGLTFDNRLTWKTHVKKAKTKAKQRLNILRCLAGTEWGADRETAYGSATKNTLKQLEPVHNQGLRIAMGAFCVTKTEELLKETGAHTLKELRTKSIAICGLRTKEKHAHPLRVTPSINLREKIYRSPHLPVPFNAGVEDCLTQFGIAENWIHKDLNFSLAPWQELDETALDRDMLEFSKNNTAIVMQNFQQQLQNYHGYTQTYTDGSKTEAGVGCSVVTRSRKRL